MLLAVGKRGLIHTYNQGYFQKQKWALVKNKKKPLEHIKQEGLS